MIYRSNLMAPDLTPHFKHLVSRPMGHSFGHDVPSDWGDKADDDPVFGLYKRCGFWTHDEAAILYHCARRIGGWWADIGAHTGWTAAHLAVAGAEVMAVDPMYTLPEFRDRAFANCFAVRAETGISYHGALSRQFWQASDVIAAFDGACIDGDHEPGEPLRDTQNAAAHLAPTGVIMFHDFIGAPVQEAVKWLIEQGFRCRIYLTPHLVACCWRGDFTPPDHVPDPQLVEVMKVETRTITDFPWEKCE